MGYESSGYGDFALRNPNVVDDDNIHQVETELLKMGFDTDVLNDTEISLSFMGWKIYNSSDEFKTVSEYLNGEFIINGEDSGDIWKLIFKKGEVLVQKGHIVYDESMILVDLNKEDWGDF